MGGDGWVGGMGDNFIALRVKTNFSVCFMGPSKDEDVLPMEFMYLV